MNTNSEQTDTTMHEMVEELLPWYVTQSLRSSESDLVREHLRHCEQCRGEAKLARTLYATAYSTKDFESELDNDYADRTYDEINARIDALPSKPKFRRILKKLIPSWGHPTNWIPSVLAIQYMVIICLGFYLVSHNEEKVVYNALSAPRSAEANIVVVFQHETTITEMQEILQKNGAKIVDGPTASGAYLLSVSDKHIVPVIAHLRQEKTLIMVEPLSSMDGDHR